MRTPNGDIYAKRRIFFLPTTDGGWTDSIWKGHGTKGFKTNRDDEDGKYISKLQKKKKIQDVMFKEWDRPINQILKKIQKA